MAVLAPLHADPQRREYNNDTAQAYVVMNVFELIFSYEYFVRVACQLMVFACGGSVKFENSSVVIERQEDGRYACTLAVDRLIITVTFCYQQHRLFALTSSHLLL